MDEKYRPFIRAGIIVLAAALLFGAGYMVNYRRMDIDSKSLAELRGVVTQLERDNRGLEIINHDSGRIIDELREGQRERDEIIRGLRSEQRRSNDYIGELENNLRFLRDHNGKLGEIILEVNRRNGLDSDG